MRAELLLELATKVRHETTVVKPAAHLASIHKALQAQLDSPSKETQTAVANAKEELIEALRNAPSEQYPPYWRRLLENAEISQFLGSGLIARVNEAISEIGTTPIESLKNIEQLLDQQKNFNNKTTQLRDALAYYEIEVDLLPPGKFEVMIAIPGDAIDDELKKFGREALEINNIILVFEEVATGSREPVKLRAIASSDPTLYVYAPWAAAALIATSIERLAKFYSQIQTIVKNHRELKAAEAPKNLLEQVEKFIDEKLNASVDKIVHDIMASRSAEIDDGRANELIIDVRRSLIEIARRLDLGYAFDVRGTAPPPAADGVEETAVEQAQRVAAKIVEDARPALQAFEASGEPILMLPKPPE